MSTKQTLIVYAVIGAVGFAAGNLMFASLCWLRTARETVNSDLQQIRKKNAEDFLGLSEIGATPTIRGNALAASNNAMVLTGKTDCLVVEAVYGPHEGKYWFLIDTLATRNSVKALILVYVDQRGRTVTLTYHLEPDKIVSPVTGMFFRVMPVASGDLTAITEGASRNHIALEGDDLRARFGAGFAQVVMPIDTPMAAGFILDNGKYTNFVPVVALDQAPAYPRMAHHR